MLILIYSDFLLSSFTNSSIQIAFKTCFNKIKISVRFYTIATATCFNLKSWVITNKTLASIYIIKMNCLFFNYIKKTAIS
jgi:hypothetical protein